MEKYRKDLLESKNAPKQIEFFKTDMKDLVSLAEKKLTDTLDYVVLSDEQVKQFKSLGWNQSVSSIVEERYIILNPKAYDKKTREYLYAKAPNEKIASLLGRPHLKPAYGFIPDGVPGVLSSMDVALLKASLNKKDFSHITGEIELEYSGAIGINELIVQELKRSWETSKFKVTLVPLNPADFLKKLFSSNGKVTLGVKGLDYFDGFSILTYFRGNISGNFFHINNPAIDKLLDEAVQIIDLEQRLLKYKEIQLAVLKEYTVIPLVFGPLSSGLWSPNCKSVPAHPGGIHTLPFETIEMK